MSLDLSKIATSLLSKLAVSESSGYLKLIRADGVVKDPVTGNTNFIQVKRRYPFKGSRSSLLEIPLTGAITSIKKETFEGNLIQNSDIFVTVDNKVKPLLSDILSVGGVKYSILSTQPKNPSGVVQTYTIHGRK